MKKSRYTEEQIAFALKQAETGTPVASSGRRDRIVARSAPTKDQSSITGANGTWRVYNLTSMMPNGPWFQDVWASPPNQTPV